MGRGLLGLAVTFGTLVWLGFGSGLARVWLGFGSVDTHKRAHEKKIVFSPTKQCNESRALKKEEKKRKKKSIIDARNAAKLIKASAKSGKRPSRMKSFIFNKSHKEKFLRSNWVRCTLSPHPPLAKTKKRTENTKKTHTQKRHPRKHTLELPPPTHNTHTHTHTHTTHGRLCSKEQ